jgi:hypothetical protein
LPSQSDGDKLVALMETYSVVYVFGDYLNRYFRKVIHGVTYIGAPSAGGTPRRSAPPYAYIHVAVHGQGLRDSVATAEKNRCFPLKGDIQYKLGDVSEAPSSPPYRHASTTLSLFPRPLSISEIEKTKETVYNNYFKKS